MRYLFILFFLTFSLKAALPPKAQEAREIKRILASKQVKRILGEKPIKAFRDHKKEDTVYEVRSKHCRGFVKIIYGGKGCEGKTEGWVGPICFNLEVMRKLICAQK